MSVIRAKGGREAALFVYFDVKVSPPNRCLTRHSVVLNGCFMSELANSKTTVWQTALRGLACKCPRCGRGKLFAGFLTLRPRCEACGLDYTFIDTGDGPAIFIIMLAGAIVVACALIVEVKYQPPFWLHAVLWLPLILVTTLLPLRSMKALLIALQFHHKAAPGRLEQRASIDREPK